MQGCPQDGGLRPSLQLGPEQGPGLTWGLQWVPTGVVDLCALSWRGKQVQFEGAKILLVLMAQIPVALWKTSKHPRKKGNQEFKKQQSKTLLKFIYTTWAHHFFY